MYNALFVCRVYRKCIMSDTSNTSVQLRFAAQERDKNKRMSIPFFIVMVRKEFVMKELHAGYSRHWTSALITKNWWIMETHHDQPKHLIHLTTEYKGSMYSLLLFSMSIEGRQTPPSEEHLLWYWVACLLEERVLSASGIDHHTIEVPSILSKRATVWLTLPNDS